MEAFWLELCAGNGFASPKIVYGGATRWESVRNAVMELQADDEAIVMVHDGARPLVSTAMIERLASQVADADGVIPGVAVTDSLRAIDGNRSTAVDRSRFVAVQTPQTFPLGVLRSAYRRPYEPTMTDDASVVEAAGFTNLLIAEGEPTNIKVTNPADLALAQTLLKLQQQ
jgi:2-C-methyl-D-erythritol 4-phosphate cytidylyltransferase